MTLGSEQALYFSDKDDALLISLIEFFAHVIIAKGLLVLHSCIKL